MCVYLRIYSYVHVSIYIYIYTCLYLCVWGFIYIYIFYGTPPLTGALPAPAACLRVYVCVCDLRVCVCVFIVCVWVNPEPARTTDYLRDAPLDRCAASSGRVFACVCVCVFELLYVCVCCVRVLSWDLHKKYTTPAHLLLSSRTTDEATEGPARTTDYLWDAYLQMRRQLGPRACPLPRRCLVGLTLCVSLICVYVCVYSLCTCGLTLTSDDRLSTELPPWQVRRQLGPRACPLPRRCLSLRHHCHRVPDAGQALGPTHSATLCGQATIRESLDQK